jgi:2-keto-4-pentenoate hydratase/2-oxohepta-3-ene-1,7-dioic acid hydratase in catechol pathway
MMSSSVSILFRCAYRRGGDFVLDRVAQDADAFNLHFDHVAGYSMLNDGSIRDHQLRTPQWLLGKNFDATGAFGPVFVTADELPAGAAGLHIQCRLNGETLQNANTRDMIFDVAALVAACSEVMTLQPGDMLITGTPAGVGMARQPPVWMKAGDVCEVEVEGIGVLRNPVVDEV